MQGVWRHSPPEAIGFFVIITPKSLMSIVRFLSKYKGLFNQIWSRGRGGCNFLEDVGCFITQSAEMTLISRNNTF